MDEQDLSYALSKQVPDMHRRGFIIGTAYGEITINPGPSAERIADFLRKQFEAELSKLRVEV